MILYHKLRIENGKRGENEKEMGERIENRKWIIIPTRKNKVTL